MMRTDMTEETKSYYDNQYFEWQAPIGQFGGWANEPSFAPFVHPEFNVVDFGCGAGWLLERLKCAGKLGVEPNSAARVSADSRGIKIVQSVDRIPDRWADLVISNHALEHCANPLLELQSLLTKLAPGGRAVFIVPCQTIGEAYRSDDVNRHLYTWNPLTLGNLFGAAGFDVEQVAPHKYIWPPRIYRHIARIGGLRLFSLAAGAYGQLTYLNLTPTKCHQVRIVARRSV